MLLLFVRHFTRLMKREICSFLLVCMRDSFQNQGSQERRLASMVWLRMEAQRYLSLLCILGAIEGSFCSCLRSCRHTYRALLSYMIQLLISPLQQTVLISNQHDMSSVLQTLLLKLKPELQKREEWSKLSQEHQLQLLRIEKVSEAFLSLIILLISSSEKLPKLTEFSMIKKREKLLTMMAGIKNAPVRMTKRILGLFITKEFEGEHRSLNNLKQEFSINYDQDDDDEEDEIASRIDEDGKQSFIHDMDDFMQEFSLGVSTASNVSERKPSELKQGTPWGDNLHYMKVIAYLKQHSSPPTELTYLCQEFGWPLSFKQELSEDGQFKVSAKVGFTFKKLSKQVSQTFVAKQKKIGRIVSSFKMLKKIYLSFPQIWDIYESKRSKKSMYIQTNQFNPLKLVDLSIIDEKIDEIAPKEQDRSEEIKKQREAYLTEILNFKSQYNILNQNNPGFFPIVYDKIQVGNNKWKVKGTMSIKYRGIESTEQACETQANSKQAQQMVTKTLVVRVYEKFREILEKMSMIKKKKGIHT